MCGRPVDPRGPDAPSKQDDGNAYRCSTPPQGHKYLPELPGRSVEKNDNLGARVCAPAEQYPMSLRAPLAKTCRPRPPHRRPRPGLPIALGLDLSKRHQRASAAPTEA